MFIFLIFKHHLQTDDLLSGLEKKATRANATRNNFKNAGQILRENALAAPKMPLLF